MPHYEFETERLLIREYKRSDISDFIRVAEQPEVYATTYGIPHIYPKKMALKTLRFIRQGIKDGSSYEFAVILRETGEYIGNVGIINVNVPHRRADISYYTDKNYRNYGYTTEAAAEMIRFGFEELGLHKISGLYMSVNPASGRVMEKLGMKYEGLLRCHMLKDGIFYDIVRKGILRDEYFTDCKS